MRAHAPDSVVLRILDLRIRVDFADPGARQVLEVDFGHMRVPDGDAPAHLRYGIDPAEAREGGRAWILRVPDGGSCLAHDQEQLLAALEADIVLALQSGRPDLFFLHAAVLERDGRAWVLAADSGVGKSTLGWALLHHGFGYLSDELAPVDPRTLRVHPYPHALCLKAAPAPPYGLPRGVASAGRRILVPTRLLPAATVDAALPIGAVLLLEPRRENGAPALRRLSAAEAAARLYVVALNALAHPDRGLGAALRLAHALPCYGLAAGGLADTCAAILEELA